MRFGKNIEHLAIPQWKQCYLEYQHLKIFVNLIKNILDMIQQCEQVIQQSKSVRTDANDQIVIFQDLSFQVNLRKEIQILYKLGHEANALFFDAHMKSMRINRLFLHMKLLQLRSYFKKIKNFHNLTLNQHQNGLLMQILQFTFVQTSYLDTAKQLNLQGQRKILKKHAKYSQSVFQTPTRRNKKVIRISKELTHLLQEMENFYVKHTPGSSKKNRDHLRQMAKKIQSSNTDSFIFGSWIGVCVTILGVLIAILAYTNKSVESDQVFNRDFPTWRGIAFFIFYIWVLGFNIYGFQKYLISHRIIFQFNQHHYSTSTDIFKISGFFSTFFLTMFTIYTLNIAQIIQLEHIRPQFLVLFVWGLFGLYLINPFPIFNFRSRLYMFKIAFKSVFAPCFGVTFPVIWMTDQVISLITPFKDFAYTICYFNNIATDISANISHKNCNSASKIQVVFLVGAFAYSLRIIQCIKQGYDKKKYFFELQFFNTVKYCFSLITLLLSFLWKAGNDSIFYAWIVSAAISTLYSYVWDIKIDWALLQPDAPHKFLRKSMCFPVNSYYVIIVLNFLLRLVWVTTLSPSIANQAFGSLQIFSLVTGMVEIIRRGIWNMLRVQRQHIANCRNFKATPALIYSIQELILKSIGKRKIQQGNHSSAILVQNGETEIQKITKQLKFVKSNHLSILYQMLDKQVQEKLQRSKAAKKVRNQFLQHRKKIEAMLQPLNIKSSKIIPTQLKKI